jgi:hypothetical protein
MIPLGSEALFPARIFRFRIGAANVASDDLRMFAQFSERPFQIRDGESPVLPICQRVLRPETIEINRHVNISAAKIGHKNFEMFAPVALQNRTATLSIFHWAIVNPGMNLQPAFALTSAIRKNIVRPPALEISTAPDCDVLDVRELKRAVDPSAAAPFRRPNVPVRMIIE